MIVGDSRADPKEAAALAHKFTSDGRIVAEIGDFSSTACLAAQPIYDRAGMVQLSPTASHPDFAPGSPWSFGIVGTQAGEGPFMDRYAAQKLGKKRIAVLHINNDWGIVSKDLFIKAAREMGADVIAVESYFETDKDFTGVLTKLRGVPGPARRTWPSALHSASGPRRTSRGRSCCKTSTSRRRSPHCRRAPVQERHPSRRQGPSRH